MDGNGCFRRLAQRTRIISTVESVCIRYVKSADGTARVEVRFHAVIVRKKIVGNSGQEAKMELGMMEHPCVKGGKVVIVA